MNGRLIHHDGGKEDSLATLKGAISSADAVIFPTDCVSHSSALELTCAQIVRCNMAFTKKILKTRKYQVLEKFVVIPFIGVVRGAAKALSKMVGG